LGKSVPKFTNFGDFRGYKPTFLSQRGNIWRESTDLGLRPPCQIL